MQNIDVDSAPSSPAPQAPSPTAPRSTTDSLVESAMSFFTDEQKSADKQPQPDADQDAAPDGAEQDQEPSGGPAEQEDVGGEPEDGEQEQDAHDTRGSREEPYNVKDLPKDKFIEIKVDGEKAVVSLDELANGYIREKTFSGRLNQTKSLADQAQAAVQQAGAFRERMRTEFQTFVRDPQQLYDFFMETDERESVLEAVAHQYAMTLRKERDTPETRLVRQRERDKRRLQWERETWQAQRDAEIAAKQKAEQDQRAISIFKPGWEDGLRRAGFPRATQELYQEVLLRVEQRARSGHQITSEDVAEITARACKFLELTPGGAKKPAPAPRRDGAAAPPKRKSRADNWDNMPHSLRIKDPDYWLRDVRPRDYR